MAHDHRHGKEFGAHDAELCASMDRAEARRVREAFDAIVRTLIDAEHRGSPRVNGHHVMEAAERVQRLSPLFAAVDVDDCVRRLEYAYAAHRAIHEARHG